MPSIKLMYNLEFGISNWNYASSFSLALQGWNNSKNYSKYAGTYKLVLILVLQAILFEIFTEWIIVSSN